MKKLKIGFIPAHRNLMDEKYAIKTKETILKNLKKNSEIDISVPDMQLTEGGLVRSEKDSEKVVELFKKEKIDALLIIAITYGDEKSIFSIVEEFCDIPVILFAIKDPEIPNNEYFKSAASCGAIPMSFGLHRRKIKFIFGGIVDVEDKKFSDNIASFIKVSKAVKKFRKARIGMIGQRQDSFEVCAVNEGLMIEKYKQRIIPLNLIDLQNDIEKIKDNDNDVTRIIDDIVSKSECSFKREDLSKIAKLELIMLNYAKDYGLDAFTFQCWTAAQEHLGITPCLINGRITNLGYPVSCEGDVYGALSMLLQRELAAKEQKNPLLLDLLMPHPKEENLFLVWHCGNASILTKNDDQVAKISSHCPFGDIFGLEKGVATLEFMFKSGIITINRLVEHSGVFKLLSVVGNMVKRPDRIRGAWSWVEVKDRNKMYDIIFREGFTHHISVIQEDISSHLEDLCKFLDFELIKTD